MKLLFLCIIFTLSGSLVSGQEIYDTAKWGVKPVHYSNPEPQSNKISFSSPSDYLLQPALISYRYLISSQDGDNCPFHPTCSQFCFESFRKTNPLWAVLLTFDRLTRDSNISNRWNNYTFDYKRYRFLDPVEDHLLY